MKYLLGLTAVMFAIVAFMTADDRAMMDCEKTHSYEVCQHTLNR